MGTGGTQGKERESQTGSMLSMEADVGLDVMIAEIMTLAKIKSWTLDGLSHAGALSLLKS